jgi:hypothetical protein
MNKWMKNIIIGVAAIAILIATVLLEDAYISRQINKKGYIEYIERFQNEYLIREADGWESLVKRTIEGELDPVPHTIYADSIDIIINGDVQYLREKFLGAGANIIPPLAVHTVYFWNTANQIPSNKRIPCYMVFCDLLDDMCLLWDLEILYAYDEINIREYLARADRCKYINIDYEPFYSNIELVEIEVAADGSIKGFDPVEWARIRGLEYDEDKIFEKYGGKK